MADDRPLREGHFPDTPAHYLHSPTDHESPRLPQTIAHRGYKGKFPENTLCAIEGAIKAGTQALELDLRLSRDGVVVLSHDATLKRCFGIKKKVDDCDWDYLKTIRTLKAPQEPMARLVDVLEFMRQPGREHVWILLDIKRSDNPDIVMKRIAETIESVPIPAIGPDWHRRVVLGCWSARYLPLCAQYLPRYSMTLICFDLGYARQFLHVPRISFNVNQMVLMGPLGRGFLEEARAAHRHVYLWTVNSPNFMRWAIRHEVDGVITDEPAQFKQICEEWKKERNETGVIRAPELDQLSVGERLQILAVAAWLVLFGWFLKLKYFPSVERVQFEQRKAS
ncbi:hypothetical protein N7448_002869 [Penicillium atrosanguineum]|uniref:Uncharacterized protein n=1 Tax=Penicillium atrosanguineum TaxID=1132637 RepID=A0A9W9H857_9EURO|nr:Sugar transporter [Penicillium atrosanguineum]KAJ5121737.1 hypothetical protein N7526_008674 [Penicillium atrosanguineum]KAJ5139461.1 hypothetical protein N7448_002869 [Penicillium atrosanguineum]KAJ5309381.1 Sugar transporter [Penicillium atrosanguineum]KAJ5314901.1 hypothetical protein N7476_005208 [Penicillium atrosanguineum]